jgi:uncharacterized membrane protein HdeD (DUF308 family)
MEAMDAERARSRWKSSVALGGATCVVGVMAFRASSLASYLAVLSTGLLLVIAGALAVLHGMGREAGERRSLVHGAFLLFTGLMLFAYPTASLRALTLLLIGYFVVAGVYRVLTSVLDRYEHWTWDLADGLLAMAAGAILIRSWPETAFWLLGALIAIELFVRGASMLAAGLSLRHGLRASGAPA